MTTRERRRRRDARLRPVIGGLAAIVATVGAVRGTQDAVANGDTRTVNLYHEHTKESASFTFKRNGYYDQDVLKQMNWFLRDWRLDEPTRMEPRLFDIVWEVYREVGAREPAHVVSAYRSPQTNAMLRRRSKAVSEHSQHMAGRAMDFYLPGASMSQVREIGMRLQAGGVGFYPNAMNPFVHLDAGSVRSWPRMSHDQLARLFPDGKTVHLPREGKPLPGYELAKAEIMARGGSVAGIGYADASGDAGPKKSLWAMLFGGGEDEDSDFYRSPASRTKAPPQQRTRVAYADTSIGGNAEDGGLRGAVALPVAAPSPATTTTPRSRRPSRTEVASLDPTLVPVPTTTPAAAPTQPEPPPALRGAATPAENVTAGVTADMPVPPRRPADLPGTLVASPLPPERPVALAAVALPVPASLNGLMRGPSRPQGIMAASADDDRAALRALFETAASQTVPSRRADIPTTRARATPPEALVRLDDPGLKVRMEFSAAHRDTLGTDSFRGSAVASLPTLR